VAEAVGGMGDWILSSGINLAPEGVHVRLLALTSNAEPEPRVEAGGLIGPGTVAFRTLTVPGRYARL
jgi:hypothetical protein